MKNKYTLRVEFDNKGFEEVGVYRTKKEVLKARERMGELKPTAVEIFKDNSLIK